MGILCDNVEHVNGILQDALGVSVDKVKLAKIEGHLLRIAGRIAGDGKSVSEIVREIVSETTLRELQTVLSLVGQITTSGSVRK